jgi:hypothetical protein
VPVSPGPPVVDPSFPVARVSRGVEGGTLEGKSEMSLGENFLHNISVDASEAVVVPGVAVGWFFLADADEAEEGGAQALPRFAPPPASHIQKPNG